MRAREIERRRAPRARAAPQGLIAPWGFALLACTLALHGLTGCASDPPGLGEQAAALLTRAIDVPTVNPPGDEHALAALLVEELRDAGLEARVIETDPGAGPDGQGRRAAAWGRLRGKSRARPVVLLSHLDVVGADPSEWSVAPFEGAITDGFVTGRGALDAKGVSVIHLMAIRELARRDEPLDRDIIFLATPDEESGGLEGARLLARDHRELLDDAEYLFTEGGSVRIADGQLPIWGVTVTEKSPCWLELTARGSPGHTSAPSSEAAVPRLVAALAAVQQLETSIRVTPEVAAMFRALAPAAAAEDRSGYRDLARAMRDDSPFRRRFLGNPGRATLVRDTIAITVLEGARRTNVAPSIARAHLDARLLPGAQCGQFARQIDEVIDDAGIEIRTLLAFPSKSSPADTPLFSAIERVAARIDPEALVVPRVIPGFTDAHYFRDLGITAYGFVPRRLTPEETRGIHGADERVGVANLAWAIEALVEILEELDAPSQSP